MANIYGQRKKRTGICSKFFFILKMLFNPRVILLPLLLCFGLITALSLFAYTLSTLEPVSVNESLTSGNFDGALKINNDLARAQRKKVGQIWKPNTVLYHGLTKKIYVGQTDGNILTIGANEEGYKGMGKISNFYYKYGRIVGLRARYEVIYVADSVNGVYNINTKTMKTNQIMPLDVVTPPIKSLMDIALASNGHIFAIDSNLKYGSEYYMHQLLEGSCTGRLMHYSPVLKKSKILKSGLCMPVGIELTFNEDCVMVSEAARGRVILVQLNDTKVASTQHLPGLPGRIRFNRRGGSWLTVQIIKNWFFKLVMPRFYLRKILTALIPQSYLRSLAFSPHTMVVELNEGNASDSLHDQDGVFNDRVTDVTEAGDGVLFLGNDNAGFIGKIGQDDVENRVEEMELPKPDLDDISKEFL